MLPIHAHRSTAATFPVQPLFPVAHLPGLETGVSCLSRYGRQLTLRVLMYLSLVEARA